MKTNPFASLPLQLGLALTLAVTPIVLPAQMPAEAPATPALGTMIKRADRAFLESAAQAGALELQISQVAVERTTRAPVRTFAQTLISHQTTAQSELASLAVARGITLPDRSNKILSNWMNKEAKDFDDDYLDEMEDSHQKAIDLCEDAVQSEDADISAFARRQLPLLEDHLTEIKHLREMTH